MNFRVIIVSLCASFLLPACDRQPDQALLPVTQLEVEADCDVLAGCRISGPGLHVEVAFETRPRALQPFPVAVKPSGLKDIKAVSVGFSMPGMAMGLNRYALVSAAGDEWRGEVTLPICVSGRTDWVAEIEMLAPDGRLVFEVPFVLNK